MNGPLISRGGVSEQEEVPIQDTTNRPDPAPALHWVWSYNYNAAKWSLSGRQLLITIPHHWANPVLADDSWDKFGGLGLEGWLYVLVGLPHVSVNHNNQL